MIDVRTESGITVLQMRHGKVNAMDIEFCRALIAELKALETGDCRAAVLTGKDRVFSAGVDLVRVVDGGRAYLQDFLPALSECLQSVFQFSKPLVSAVNGHAIAGGCMLSTACDRRVTHAKARIGIPEMRIGVPLPSVAIEIMRFAVVPEAMQSMVNAGKSFRGEEAVRVGLADQVVDPDEVLEAAIAAANELLIVPPAVFTISKSQLRAPANRNIEANQAEFESAVVELWQNDEIMEGVKKYVSERL